MAAEKKEFLKVFDAKKIGESFNEVGNEIIKTSQQNVVNKWYHSEQDADLFVWYDEKHNIIKQQILFCGQVVDWNVIDGVRTGFIFENFSDNLEEHAEVQNQYEIRYDNSLQNNSLLMACDLVRHIEIVEVSQREMIEHNFKNSPNIDQMTPGDFLKKYGKALEVKTQRPSVFNQLVSYFRRRLS